MVPLMAAHNGGRLLRRRFLPVRNYPRLGATGAGRAVGIRLLPARDAWLLRICLLQAITSRDAPTRHQAWDCSSSTPWWDMRRIIICMIKIGATLAVGSVQAQAEDGCLALTRQRAAWRRRTAARALSMPGAVARRGLGVRRWARERRSVFRQAHHRVTRRPGD